MRSALMMAALAVVGLTPRATLAQSSAPAPPAWRNARWGMTVGEVRAAFPGEAVRVTPRRGRGKVLVATEKIEIYGRDYGAAFWFRDEDGRLAGFNLRPVNGAGLGEGDYQRMKQLLVQEYGRPAREVSNPEVGLGYWRADWFLPQAHVNISFLAGARNLLQINYAPPNYAPPNYAPPNYAPPRTPPASTL